MTDSLCRRLALVVLAIPMAVGCDSVPRGTEGDCHARIVYDDVTYRPHGASNQAARGDLLGTGGVLDCEGDTVPEYGTVKVFAIKGVDSSVAVKAGTGSLRGVYVAEGTPRSAWPSFLTGR